MSKRDSPEVVNCPCCGHDHADLIVHCPKCTEETLFGGLSIQVTRSNCIGCPFFNDGGEYYDNDCTLCGALAIDEDWSARDAMNVIRPKYCPLQKNDVIVKLKRGKA